jgi:hypothetical protein
MLVDDLMEKVDPVQAIEADMSPIYKHMRQENSVYSSSEYKPVQDVYSSLEEIVTELDDIREYGMLGSTIEKLQRTIQSGAYIQTNGTI